MNLDQTIDVTAGGKEYTWPVTLKGDRDITSATVQVGLGSYTTPPATWVTPPISDRPDSKTVTVQMLVDDTTPTGTYYLWTQLTVLPEIVIRRAHRIYVL